MTYFNILMSIAEKIRAEAEAATEVDAVIVDHIETLKANIHMTHSFGLLLESQHEKLMEYINNI